MEKLNLSDNGLYAIIWSLVALAFIVVVVSITSYNQNTENNIAKMGMSGVNPIEASCAVNAMDRHMCTIYLTGQAVSGYKD